MRIQKKVSKGNWAKVGEDIVDEGTITILNSGEQIMGEYGERTVFLVKTKNGERNLAFNRTSLNNLVDALGEDTEKWKGQMVKSYIVKQMIGDGLKKVVYLCGVNWNMTDDGQFVNGEAPADIPVIEVEDEIAPF
jgi:hypothetical protein